MNEEYFPVVILCPDPAFNLSSIEEEDYEEVAALWAGNIDFELNRNSSKTMSFSFWGGKQNITQRKLIEKVTVAFNSSDWIKNTAVTYESAEVAENYKFGKVNLIPQRTAYPLGRCLKLDIFLKKLLTPRSLTSV